VQKIKFVGVIVFEKKRFETIVDGNAYAYTRQWHKDTISMLNNFFTIGFRTKNSIYRV
jgi:hypothetical protein